MPLDGSSSWERLWADMAPRLLAYLRAFGGLSREDREDLVQRSFLKAWEGRSGLRDGLGMRAWFHKVARNQALDLLKVRDREGRRFPAAAPDEEGRPPEAPCPRPGPEESVMMLERSAFMEAFLAGLGEVDREFAHLRHAEGLGYAEISRVTGEPIGTVKWRSCRLRERLEAAWRKEYGE